ncbi:MAG TPA: type II toxin-antitoxin system VapC family toxin [Caulobacteraceae bacterium]|nr:type II toxin-antitoxin system VapC family toxin [Caulobacteraceae bacterium]
MTLALDTNVVIDVVRGRKPALRQRFIEALMGDRPVVASLIVLHELRLGCALNRDPYGELVRVRAALADIPIEPLDEDDVVTAAEIGAGLARRGMGIGTLDLLIAGQALARGWTLVTANLREFSRIEGLNVIDWTEPAD